MKYAFDKKTVRTLDADGRLHVEISNISKAMVSPYYGREIVDYKVNSLDANKIYYLLRDPDELEKAASTFNNLPILSKHVPVDAQSHEPDIVIGSTGTDCVFEAPYLKNSSVIWVQSEIDLIQANAKKEWSCAYRYDLDLTPGEYEGVKYDGIMRNIIGNHVALVEEGRAGPDVYVNDQKPKGFTMIKSKLGLMLQGALSAYLAPKLAKDQALDLTALLDNVNAKNVNKTKLANSVAKLAKPMLASDEGLDVSDVVEIIEAVQGVESEDDDVIQDEEDDEDKKPAMDDDCIERIMSFLEGKLSESDLADLKEVAFGEQAAADACDEDDDEKPAMDAALIRKQAIAEMNEIRKAERAVEPLIGVIKVAVDSASAVYKLALDANGINTKGVHPSAFGAMVAMIGRNETKPVAMDHAAGASDFNKRFPNASKLVRS